MANITDTMSAFQLTIYDRICSCGWAGATVDELEEFTGKTHQSVSARVNELEKAKHVERRASQRKTRSGRKAFIFVMTGLKRSNKEEP